MASITIETGIIMSAAGIAVTLGSQWITRRLKERSDSIRVEELIQKHKELTDLEIKHISEKHDKLEKRFDDYEKEQRKKDL